MRSVTSVTIQSDEPTGWKPSSHKSLLPPDGDVRSVHSRDEDWDVPQAQKKLKGKAIQPEGSRRSAFQRLGHEGRNQNRPAKERLGVETTPLSAFNRLGRGAERPGQTRRTEPPHREEPQHSRAPHEEEAESHPRHMTRTHVEPRDRVDRVEARLEKLQRRVDREEKKKVLLNESPFTDRVHETPFPKKAKLEVPKFTGKEDPEIHEKFKENCTKRKKFTYLSKAGQREHEDFTKFLTRWKDEVDKVEEMDDKTTISLLVSGLRSGELYKEFCRRPPQSYQEAYNTAWDYADAEAQVSSKREAEQGHSKGKIPLKKEIELPGREKAEVMEVKPVKTEKKPTGGKQWTEKYCSFHKTDSHNIAECNSVKGVIKQMIEVGEIDPEYLAKAKQKKNQWVVQKQMRFVVVNIKCVHNAILGRPGINKVRGVISMAHLCMKFYTPGGIGQVRGDQKKARHCYLEAVKKMTKAFERVTLVSQEEDRLKLEPGDETEQIVLQEAFPERMVRIGRDLPGGLRDEIISVLREYADTFAWSVADMPGIDRSVICHHFLVELTGLEPEAGPSHTVEPWWDMAVDGASGPKGCAAGVVFTTPEGFKIYHALVFNFKLTNNEAEYEALAGGLRLARSLGVKRMKIRSDSSLVVGQVNGEMEVKEDHLARYAFKIDASLPGACVKVGENRDTGRAEHRPFEVAAIQPGQTSATGIIGADDDWRYELMEYLETGQKPDDEERARKVVLRAPRFQVIDGHLYKRAIGGPLLRCLTNPEAERVIAENEVDHLAELNLVEERRTTAAVKMAGYQQSVKRYHDNRVGPRYFQVHDEVLRRRDASKPNERGKLVRNWEGPYRIKAIVRPGTYQLETMEGCRVDRHWNSHHLRKFYR
ncbi:unnamed protein product [Cuscuta campestris]|uniref:RNase H type-1 domain-containing protein n=1 Tax=Cuscuta campestris TaxID=132261 RepID=A0A484LKW9_9ASTE|nr:unnamed protein product [Cuscuta campestris]